MKKTLALFACIISLHFTFSQETKAYTPNEVDEFPKFEENPCAEAINQKSCFETQVIKHVSAAVQYPKDALLQNEEGVVYLQFEVDSNGIVKNIKGRAKNEAFKKEAIRVIGMLPKFNPALKDGKPVAFVFGLPVHFVLPKPIKLQIEYFPREQLIHPNLKNGVDANEYLETLIKNKVVAILNQKSSLATIKKYAKDTLSIRLSVEVDQEGNVKNKKNRVQTNSKKVSEKLRSSFTEILTTLPKFEVQNRKADTIVSRHFFNFLFLTPKEKKASLREIATSKKYEGGTVEEMPIFPGCENVSYDESKRCFQLMMQAHIKKHFTYPEEAARTGKSGKVNIVFNITDEGTIENIRTRGPHKILEKEAVRIISLLPRINPGKHNGKPVKFPFSIPITFRL